MNSIAISPNCQEAPKSYGIALLEYCVDHGNRFTIDELQASHVCGNSPSKVLSVLRKKGYLFEVNKVSGKNRYGKNVSYNVYTYLGHESERVERIG